MSESRHVVFVVLVVLHVATAVIGFATVAIEGVYGASWRRWQTETLGEETKRFFASDLPTIHALWAVPVLGLAALAVEGGNHFGQAWAVSALLLWVLAAAVATAVVVPARRSLQAELVGVEIGATVPAGTRATARRLSRGAAVCDVVFVIAFVLMIFRPARF